MSTSEAVREAAKAELARRRKILSMAKDAEDDLLCFVRLFWRVLEPEKKLIEGWVLDCLCDVLMAVTDGHLNRVNINVVPGSMKSSLLNCLWPAWEWGPQNMPWLRYLSASYSTGIPERDNIRFARIVNDPVYRLCWGDRVKLTREGSEVVENAKTGWKRVTSTGGGTTGWRGDRILCDDLNNPNNVESEDVRGSTNKWVREIMPDRLNDLGKSVVINLQQRTHEDDATGTLIKYGQGYEFISIPMEFDPLRISRVVMRRNEDGEADQVWTDPRALGADGKMLAGLTTNQRGEPRVLPGSLMAKAEGTLCWPERFPPDLVRALQAEKGQYAWDSQYNQIPGVRGGSIIRKDWWRLWSRDEYPELGTILVILDTAVEEGTQNDYNACVVLGAFAGEEGEPLVLLLEAWRARLPLAELVERVAVTCRRRKADYLLIEHRTRGRDVHDEICRIYQDGAWITVLVKVETSKVARLKAVEGLFSGDYRKDAATGIETWDGGVVYAPDKDWAQDVIDECASFPYGAHDDYVDCMSMGLGWIRKNGVVLRKIEFEMQELERKRYRKPMGVPYAIART
jgi:predicted phage terminase large subunit-like protein